MLKKTIEYFIEARKAYLDQQRWDINEESSLPQEVALAEVRGEVIGQVKLTLWTTYSLFTKCYFDEEDNYRLTVELDSSNLPDGKDIKWWVKEVNTFLEAYRPYKGGIRIDVYGITRCTKEEEEWIR